MERLQVIMWIVIICMQNFIGYLGKCLRQNTAVKLVTGCWQNSSSNIDFVTVGGEISTVIDWSQVEGD